MPTLLVRCPNRRDSFPCVLTDGIFFHVSKSNKVQRNATSSYRGKRRSPATNTLCAKSTQDGILFHAHKSKYIYIYNGKGVPSSTFEGWVSRADPRTKPSARSRHAPC